MRTSHCGCHFWMLFGRFSKTERICNNLLVANTHVWWTKTENITTEMRFALIFKMDAIGKSHERQSPDVTLRPLYDVLGTFFWKPKTTKQLSLWCFRHIFGEIKLKIMQWRCICTTSLKLTSWRRPKEVTW